MDKLIALYNMDIDAFIPTIENNSIDLILIDPPYPINTNNGTNRFSQNGWIDGSSDGYNIEWYNKFSLTIESLMRTLKEGRHFYCFVDEKNLFILKPYLDKYMTFKKVIVWHKKSFGLGYHYRNIIEYCLLYTKGKSKRHIIDQPNFFMGNKDDVDFHPTSKNTDMLRWLIRNSTDKGDVVLDGYSGSGTTAIACFKEDRNFTGCEINKDFYDKSLQRIKDAQLQLGLI